MRSTVETDHPVVLPQEGGESGSGQAVTFGIGRYRAILFLGDLFVAAASALFFLWMSAASRESMAVYPWAALSTIFFCPAACYMFDLYNLGQPTQSLKEMLKRSVLSVLLVGLSLMVLHVSLGGHLNTIRIILQMMLLWMGIVLWREVYMLFSQSVMYKKPTLILGAGESGKALYELLKLPLSPYQVKGFVDDDVSSAVSSPSLPDVLGRCDQLSQIAKNLGARDAILAVPNNRSPEFIRSVLKARMEGTVIREMADVYEQLTGRIPVAHIEDQWLLFARGFSLLNRPYLKHVKRVLDIIVSTTLLLFALPIMAFASLLIRLDSPGAILYSQKRVGKDQDVFVLYKFRSMSADAEAKGVQWASSNDPRVTRVGRFIRRYRIDEIPQLFNVFKGDMSLVGPRPERPEFVRILEAQIPYYFIRHAVKPGVTGWAQVTFRYGASLQDSLHKLEADLYYIKNMSFLLDLKILLRTVGVVFLAEGSR